MPSRDDIEFSKAHWDDKISELETKIAQLTLGSGPQLALPRWDGSADIQQYLERLYAAAGYAGMSDEKLLKAVPLLLTGEAAAVYESLGNTNKTSWKSLLDAMAKRMSNPLNVEYYHRLLLERKKRVGESLAEYGNAVKHLVKRAFPSGGKSAGFDFSAEQQEAKTVDYFISGLSPQLKASLLRQKKPATLGDALDAAKAEERILSAIEENEVGRRDAAMIAHARLDTDAEVEQLRRELEELKEIIAESTGSPFIGNINQNYRERAPFRNNSGYYGQRNGNNFRRDTRERIVGDSRWVGNNYNSSPFNRDNFLRSSPRSANFSRDIQSTNPRYDGPPPSSSYHQPSAPQWNGPSHVASRGNGRGRGNRGRFRISAVLPMLTLLCIFLPSRTFGQYQICPKIMKGISIAAPAALKCEIPREERGEPVRVRLYTHRVTPRKFVLYECQMQNSTTCTSSTLKFISSIHNTTTFAHQ